MSLFKKYLQDSESIFKNEVSLDSNFIPKGKLEFRENENQYIATCIKPLFQRHSGKNLIVYGPPGVGKTLACLKIKEELEETLDEILVFYINLWKKNTSHKIILEICSQLDYKFTINKSTDELFEIIKQKINQKSAVFIFDEIDKADTLELLYSLTEDIYRKTIILLTNNHDFIYRIDPRLKSRLVPDQLEFKAYNLEEIGQILKKRTELAFNTPFPTEAFSLIKNKTYELKDIRMGLFLLKETGLIADAEPLKQITLKHAQKAVSKLKNFQKPSKLNEEEEKILKTITENPNKTTLEIFNLYQKSEKNIKTLRTFQRKVKNLEKANLVQKEELLGQQGKTHILKPSDAKLSDF